MPINILMPALSPTMEKGNLAKWLKKEGDKVKSGDVIAEIETDKATMEVEAVDEGTIAKILVPEGTQDVPVNDIIAVLAGDGEDVKAAGAGAGTAPAPKAAEAPAAKPRSRTGACRRTRARPAATAPTQAAAPQAAAAAPQANGHARVFSSPLARRLAKEAGIDIARIDGSGPHGRVVARDVEGAKSGKGLKAPAAAPAAAPGLAPGMSDKQILALYEEGSYEIVPHDGMRRTIAQRLTVSVQTVPVFYLTMDCDIGKLLVAREEINAAAPEGQGKEAALQALGQRLRHQGDGGRAAADSGLQRELDRRRHAQAQAFRHRRGGRDAGRADHADHPQGRDQDAVGNFRRDEGFCGARAGAKTEAGRISGRHHRGVQPRHVRHQPFHRRDQPAAGHHPRGRHQRGARGSARPARSRSRR